MIPPSPVSRSALIVLLLALTTLWSACTDDGPLFPANDPPSADAGSDRLVEAGEQTRLDGSDSADNEGENLDYAWSLVSGPAWVAITDVDGAQAHVTFDVAGEYVFRLTVTDPSGATDRDDMHVFVTTKQPIPINTAPSADAGSDGRTAAGLEFVLDGSASDDADGDELTYAWVQISGPSVAIVEGNRSRARVTPLEEGDYLFRLTVIDAAGGSAHDEVLVLATRPIDPNGKPSADAGSDLVIFAGETAMMDAGASTDPEGDRLSFSWIQLAGPAPVPIVDASQQVAQVTPMDPGVYLFRLTVADGLGASATAQVQITVRSATGRIEIEAVFGGQESGG